MRKNRIFLLLLLSMYCIPLLHAHIEPYNNESYDSDQWTDENDTMQTKKHHCCRGPQDPQGPQGPPGQQGPPGPVINEHAFIYSTQTTALAPGASIPFDQNGIVTSGFTHSTVSNTDQIIVNNAGTYRIDFTVTSGNPMFFAITINGVIQPATRYGTNTGGTILAGTAIVSLSSGDIIRVINYSVATTTTLSNASGLNPRISASIIIENT